MELNYYFRPEVSNSELNSFHSGGARNFKYYKDGLLDEDLRAKKSKALKKGKAFHSLLLEPDYYKLNYIPIEVNTPSSGQQKQFCVDFVRFEAEGMNVEDAAVNAIALNYKAPKDGQAEKLYSELSHFINYLKIKESESIILTSSEHESIDGAVRAIKSDDQLAYLFEDKGENILETYNELEIYWNVEWCNLDLRSRLDRVIVTESSIIYIDPKSTQSTVPYRFKKDIYYYKLHQQMSFYEHALKEWSMKKYGEIKEVTIYLLGIEMTQPHDRVLFKMTDSILEEGRKLWSDKLERLSWHYNNGVWINKDFYEKGYVTIEHDEEI